MVGLLDGRTAIVTGSARGIGRAVAELLVEQGANVLVTDVDQDAVHETAKALGAAAHHCDITAPEAPAQLVDDALDTFGTIDIVVNNAGYTLDGVLHTMNDDDFQAMLDVHLLAPFRLLRAAAPYLRDRARKEKAEGREVLRKVVNVTGGMALGMDS